MTDDAAPPQAPDEAPIWSSQDTRESSCQMVPRPGTTGGDRSKPVHGSVSGRVCHPLVFYLRTTSHGLKVDRVRLSSLGLLAAVVSIVQNVCSPSTSKAHWQVFVDWQR